MEDVVAIATRYFLFTSFHTRFLSICSANLFSVPFSFLQVPLAASHGGRSIALFSAPAMVALRADVVFTTDFLDAFAFVYFAQNRYHLLGAVSFLLHLSFRK